MNWFNSIKRFYPRFWTAEMVGDAVVCQKITADEYKLITGLEYDVSEPEE